jgi:hypothetical protein
VLDFGAVDQAWLDLPHLNDLAPLLALIKRRENNGPGDSPLKDSPAQLFSNPVNTPKTLCLPYYCNIFSFLGKGIIKKGKNKKRVCGWRGSQRSATVPTVFGATKL